MKKFLLPLIVVTTLSSSTNLSSRNNFFDDIEMLFFQSSPMSINRVKNNVHFGGYNIYEKTTKNTKILGIEVPLRDVKKENINVSINNKTGILEIRVEEKEKQENNEESRQSEDNKVYLYKVKSFKAKSFYQSINLDTLPVPIKYEDANDMSVFYDTEKNLLTIEFPIKTEEEINQGNFRKLEIKEKMQDQKEIDPKLTKQNLIEEDRINSKKLNITDK
ncbi:hypothetical protein K9L05_04365 [Candidatus Babeliales bacterium]|nr:hypothetical protein [Candidatus Babeliales bacterium]